MKRIIQFLRISKLMQKVMLNRRQRLSVPYFRRYTIHDYQLGKEDERLFERGLANDRIINECEPEANELDKRILYELTGIRLRGQDFKDESS